MPHLVITCRFVAHSYTGVRLTEERREELDWPPSPGRLHQALMAAAFTGLPPKATEMEAPRAALHWLERQPAPVILASKLVAEARTRPRVAIPQNNPKGADLGSNSMLLAPTTRATPASLNDFEVRYHWTVQKDAEDHLPALMEMVARLTYLGRGEDRVEAEVQLQEEPVEFRHLEQWAPATVAAHQLWLPRAGTTRDLEHRFHQPVSARERRPPAQRFMIAQPYAQAGVQPRLPVHVALFQVIPDSGDPDATALSCDPEVSGRWRAIIRGRIIEIARDSSLWQDPALAVELLTGRRANSGKRTERPHLAIVPLPSFNASGKADGRVRRIALLGYALPEIAKEAHETYETLASILEGDSLSELKGHLRKCEPTRDAIWPQLLPSSRVWTTLTPVAISRGFKVPRFAQDGRELTANERYRHKLAEWAALLKVSLGHTGLPESLIRDCAIELTASPLLPKTVRAEQYRPPGESAVLVHVRLEFPEPVSGPLILGDRRYQGLGLLAPV